MVNRCPEYDTLSSEVNEVLERIAELTKAQRQAFRDVNNAEFHRLDKELEQLIGHKERSIGALRQHVKEHQCQPK